MLYGLSLCLVASTVGKAIPCNNEVNEAFLETLQPEFPTSDGNLFSKYAKSFISQIDSLIEVLRNGDAFHTDAVLFSLLDMQDHLKRVKSSGVNFPNYMDSFSFTDYEILLKSLTTVDKPGINNRFANSSYLSELASEYSANFEIIYIADVLDNKTFNRVLNETSRLWRSNDIEANCNLDGVHRMGGYLHFSDDIPAKSQRDSMYSLIFGNEELRLLVSSIVGAMVYASDFPIELREYGEKSRGMGCHSDIQMYEELRTNFELVFTVSNQGKCEVYWYDRNNIKHSVWPNPNSLTIVHPNAAVHCVSPTQGGPREMLKFIMVGSYKKSRSFYSYVDNKCDGENPNQRAIKNRRVSMLLEPEHGEL